MKSQERLEPGQLQGNSAVGPFFNMTVSLKWLGSGIPPPPFPLPLASNFKSSGEKINWPSLDIVYQVLNQTDTAGLGKQGKGSPNLTLEYSSWIKQQPEFW